MSANDVLISSTLQEVIERFFGKQTRCSPPRVIDKRQFCILIIASCVLDIARTSRICPHEIPSERGHSFRIAKRVRDRIYGVLKRCEIFIKAIVWNSTVSAEYSPVNNGGERHHVENTVDELPDFFSLLLAETLHAFVEEGKMRLIEEFKIFEKKMDKKSLKSVPGRHDARDCPESGRLLMELEST